MSDDQPSDPLAEKRRGNLRIAELAAEAKPAEVTEVGFRKLFENWEHAGITIGKARKMLADAIVHEQQCAENIVRKLGRGHFRYKETLYTVSASKRGIIYLKPLIKRPNNG